MHKPPHIGSGSPQIIAVPPLDSMSLSRSISGVTFFRDSLRVFKRAFPLIFPLIVISSNLEQSLNKLVEGAIRNPDGVQTSILFYGAISIAWSVAFPILMTSVVLFFLCSETGFVGDLRSFLKRYLNQLYIEVVRSWGRSLLYGLFFILPGLWKFVKLSYVPYVVVASKTYDEGQIDALKASESIFSRNRFLTLLIFFGAYLFIPIFMAAMFDGYRSIFETPFSSLLLNSIDTYFIILVNFILFTIFKNEVRKSDSHV